jgi:hypothetical protein
MLNAESTSCLDYRNIKHRTIRKRKILRVTSPFFHSQEDVIQKKIK